jgi:glycosyltransferase involved in cell wall biosynthesis
MVSVVIPVHNDTQYLRECLDSVVDQTLRNIEIICVDDASTDGSGSILDEYAARHSRIRLIRYATNRSASQARKDGALAATGEYLMFLDADDYLERDACERLYGEIRKHGVEILHFGTTVINERDLPKERVDNIKRFTRPHPGRLEGPEVFEACFRDEKYGFTIWNKIYSAELCRRAFPHIPDGSFPKAQDLLAFFVLAFFARSYVGLENVDYHHYRYGAGLTGHNQMPLGQFETHCSQVRVSFAIRRFLEEQGVFEKYRAEHQRIHGNLLFECIWNWLRHLAPNHQGRGFDMLVTAWGADDIASCLVWRKEYDKARMELVGIRRSWSFRIGAAILFVPGKIYAWWKRGRRI